MDQQEQQVMMPNKFCDLSFILSLAVLQQFCLGPFTVIPIVSIHVSAEMCVCNQMIQTLFLPEGSESILEMIETRQLRILEAQNMHSMYAQGLSKENTSDF